MNTITSKKNLKTSNSTPSKPKTRSRTVYYFRADPIATLSDPKMTLQTALEQSWAKLNQIRQRTTPSNGKTLVGMDSDQRSITHKGGTSTCLVFTLGVTERGALANIINTASTGSLASLQSSTHQAPNGSEYLDGEAFICVMENHILISPCDALRGPISNKFIKELLKKAAHADARCFNIVQVANQKTMQTVLQEGVKRIELNTSLFMASYERMKSQITAGTFTDKLGKQVGSLMKSIMPGKTQKQILDYESLTAKLIISHDMRVASKNAVQEGQDVTDGATELLDANVEGFTLLTSSGKKITRDQVIMNEKIDIEAHGKSVKQDLIWNALSYIMEKYSSKGVLDK
ncbi:hypothetical protein RC856_003221 [Vibrio fluvialis]|nr:hypothetical protein [Vibrio fluvialis]